MIRSDVFLIMKDNNSLEERFSSPRRNIPVDLEPFELFDDNNRYYSDGNYEGSVETSGKQQFFKILKTVRKHWLLIFAITLTATALVVVYEAQKPEYYTAVSRVQVNNEVNPAAGNSKGGSIIVAGPANDPAYFTTQLQIIEGAGLLKRVVKAMDLENNQAFLRPDKGQEQTVFQNVLRMFGLSKQRARFNPDLTADENPVKNNLVLKDDETSGIDADLEAEQMAPYVSYLRNSLKVAPVKDNRTSNKETRLIEISFTHRDPVIAAKMANAIADTYVLHNLEQKVQTNAAAGDFLQKRVAELQSLIRSGEERLINYSKSNQILSLDSTQNTVVQRLSDLNGKLGQAENDRIAAQAAYQAALNNPMASVTAETKDARTASLEEQLSALRQRLEQLKTEYTEAWPEVVQVRRQMETIEKELQNNRKRASGTQIAALEQSYREAQARETDLRNYFQQQRGEVLRQNEAAINYRIIQQEIDTNKTLLDGLLQRSREVDVVLNGTPNNVNVLDRALTPRSPAGPQRAQNIIAAFLLSLMAGVGLSFLTDLLKDRITVSDNLESDFGLPLLGVIPETRTSLANKLNPGRLLPARHARNKQKIYDLQSFEEPVIAESYLSLRTYLLLSTPGGPPRTCLITSSQPGEGKSVTALNLAKNLAQTGASVLLIDADLRCPRLHSINNLSNETGLTNLLTVKENGLEVIAQVVKKGGRLNPDILTAGPAAPNPANLLGSPEMKRLLNQLKTQYSFIIIDSPPILYFADSVILSTFVEATILVARENLTRRQLLLLAKKKLLDVRAKVVGFVLNGVKLKNSKYYEYEKYSNLELAPGESRDFLKLN